MNDQTMKLVEDLAQKLGTTAEYLWQVLLKQAPISATINLLYFLLVIISGVVLYKLHRHFSKTVENGNYSIYDDREEVVIVPMLIGCLVWGVLFIVCLICLGGTINGFVNPEYWALDKILSVYGS